MAGPAEAALGKSRWLSTDRADIWWAGPLVTAVVLLSFVGYATYRVFTGGNFEHGELLSPFFSPNFEKWFHIPFGLTPAFLILPVPAGFRMTCYYYRKAYYRSFFLDPVACAVGEGRKGYLGEAKFPFILQNLHRYTLYAALAFLVILWWDVIKAFTIAGSFGVGGGSLAILASTLSLTIYTFSCHSLRHLVGGRLDCFSCVAAGGPQQKAWGFVSVLNGHHMAFAWWSLFFVCLADFYVRMCSMGVIHDPMWTFHHLFDTAASTGL